MKAHVRPHNGTPTLFLNDQPVFADMHWVGYLDPSGLEDVTRASIQNFANSNVHIFSTDAMTYDWHGPRDGRLYDFEPVARRLQMAIDIDPDAHFLLRIMFETKYLLDDWWHKTHPEELELLSDGTRPSASYASQEWIS